MLLFEKPRAVGTDVKLITVERMIHCYLIIPLLETEAAQFIIWADTLIIVWEEKKR